MIRAWEPYSSLEPSTYEFNLADAVLGDDYTDDFSKYNGRYSNTIEFASAPAQFLSYVIDTWKRYVEENLSNTK